MIYNSKHGDMDAWEFITYTSWILKVLCNKEHILVLYCALFMYVYEIERYACYNDVIKS